mgnify:CR=1 FL=1
MRLNGWANSTAISTYRPHIYTKGETGFVQTVIIDLQNGLNSVRPKNQSEGIRPIAVGDVVLRHILHYYSDSFAGSLFKLIMKPLEHNFTTGQGSNFGLNSPHPKINPQKSAPSLGISV